MEIARGVLQKLASEGTYLAFDLATKTVTLHAMGNHAPVAPADLLILFENGWVARYDTVGQEHRYRITATGRDNIQPKH